jgi:hypothetical protein
VENRQKGKTKIYLGKKNYRKEKKKNHKKKKRTKVVKCDPFSFCCLGTHVFEFWEKFYCCFRPIFHSLLVNGIKFIKAKQNHWKESEQSSSAV